ncbi:fimbrial biogenesis outer membrane usher protein [Achromobacter denitrificans]|nr:fimbrial biogenesis outer membrane usher protein [Achromobacter denitrificans]
MASGYRGSGQRVFEGVVRSGLSDLVTGYGGLAFSDYYSSALAGAALNTRIGAFSGDATIARANLPGGRTSGASYRFSYSKNLPNSGTSFSLLAYRYSTSGFVGLNEAVALRDAPHIGGYGDLGRLRNRLDTYVNQDLGGYGSMYLNGSALQYWNRPGSAFNYSAGYRSRWGPVSYALSLQRVHALSRAAGCTRRTARAAPSWPSICPSRWAAARRRPRRCSAAIPATTASRAPTPPRRSRGRWGTPAG